MIANSRYVRLNVPELGLGSVLDEMVLFCLERSEQLRAGCMRTHSDQRDWLVFYFRDPTNAEDFAERFRGELFEPGDDRISLH